MEFLHAVAQRLLTHIHTRDQNGALKAALDQDCQRHRAKLNAVAEQLREGRGVRPEDAMRVMASLPPYRHPEGCMRWGEQWIFPAEDLLMALRGDGPYDPTWKAPPKPGGVRRWEGHLQAVLKAEGHVLLVHIPLTPLPWTEPRGWTWKLKPEARRFGYKPRKWEEQFLRQARERRPDLPHDPWRMQITPDTPLAEVWTLLVVGALRYQFPVAMAEQEAALRWVECLCRQTTGSLEPKGVADQVLQRLITAFDWPATPWSFSNYARITARGYGLNEEQGTTPGPFLDATERVYAPQWVARQWGVHVSTVYRWMQTHGATIVQGRRGLSEAQWHAFQQEQAEKAQRKRLFKRGAECGVSAGAIKKLCQRKKKADGTPDWEAIAAHIRSGATNPQAMVSSAIALEDQIAAYQAQLAGAAPGSDEWIEAHDALCRFQQMHQGSDG